MNGNGNGSAPQKASGFFGGDPSLRQALSRFHRLSVCCWGLLLIAPSFLSAAEVQLRGHTFTLPDGFVLEVIAAPPLVNRPIVADFDFDGRLYVADSSGTNDRVDKQLAERPHRIVRLEDTDGDGQFDKSVVFADKMMFPEGAMWYDGSLYVSAPPSIWKLTDTDGDGVADQREEWFKGKTLTNCANDLHGPYLGPDGWIYWAKGAFAKQTYERPGRAPFVTRAAHIFRCRPDGTGIEAVMTGGMDNPVDVVFSEGGERMFTTTFLQHPGGGLRDGIIHAIYGGVYGKVHDVIEGHPRTSAEMMPTLVHLGPAAPCGFTRYDSTGLGVEFRGNLFATLFNMHKVTRHIPQTQGATYTTKDEDFLFAQSTDFHPTDIQEDADGSLVVVDTGGWYKLCCPTSQLWKPDLLGAIYRIRRDGAARPADPRGREVKWQELSADQLAGYLGDARPVVRRRATERLVRLAEKSLPVLRRTIEQSTQPRVRLAAVWTAGRIDAPEARALVRGAIRDRDETVRQAAMHLVSLNRDHNALPELLEVLRLPSQHNRRVAAEALGRIGDKTAVPHLLRALGESPDRILEHSLTFACIEIGAPEETAQGLKPENPLPVRRAALVALGEMEGKGLDPRVAVAELKSTHSEMRETAAWILGRHPEWGDVLVDVLRQRLSDESASDSDRTELARQLGGYAGHASIQELMSQRLTAPDAKAAERLAILRALTQAYLRSVPDGWVTGIAANLSGQNADVTTAAVTTARDLRTSIKNSGNLPAALLAVAGRNDLSASIRLDALSAIPGGATSLSDELFEFLRSQLEPSADPANRVRSAEVLSQSMLNSAQLISLAEMIRHSSPLEIGYVINAFGQSTDADVGRQLVAVLKDSPALAGLRSETLKPILAKFGEPLQTAAGELMRVVEARNANELARLEEFLRTMPKGDINRGQAIFNQTKLACITCHSIGYVGGKVGPDLTKIGQIRTERDLLESIMFPSLSFVRSYEPLLVATKDGKTHNGTVRRDSLEEMVLATGPNQEVRIPKADIEEVQAGTVSVMPAGLDKQLSAQDLADLVTFLKACK